MTAAVIELDGYRHAWTWGWARCHSCWVGRWVAVAHAERLCGLLCPSCGELDGYIYDEQPDEGDE